jgi:hypothetical protein
MLSHRIIHCAADGSSCLAAHRESRRKILHVRGFEGYMYLEKDKQRASKP